MSCEDHKDENSVCPEKTCEKIEEPHLASTRRINATQRCHLPSCIHYKPLSSTMKVKHFTSNKPRFFTFDEEKKLAANLIKMTSRGFVFSEKEVARFAYDFAEANNIPHKFCPNKKAAGIQWIKSFKRSNPDVPVTQSSPFPELHCEKRTSKEEIHKYFNVLRESVHQHQILRTPQLIYNVDETDYSTANATKESNLKSTKLSQDHAKMIVCINVTGQRIPPLAVYLGGKQNANNEKNSPHDTLVTLWEHAEDDEEVFVRWLRHFQSYRNPGPCLLLLDGNPWHKTCRVFDFCESNGIRMICLPAESLQPLDRILPEVKWNFNDKCATLRAACQRTNKLMLGRLLSIAVGEVATHSATRCAFAEVGVFPLSLDVMLENVRPLTTRFTQDSSMPWREVKIEQLEFNTWSFDSVVKQEVILPDSNLDLDESLPDAEKDEHSTSVPEDIVSGVTVKARKNSCSNVDPREFCLVITEIKEDTTQTCAFCNLRASDPVSVIIGDLIQCQGEGREWYHRRCVGAEPYEYFTCGRCVVRRIRAKQAFKAH